MFAQGPAACTLPRLGAANNYAPRSDVHKLPRRSIRRQQQPASRWLLVEVCPVCSHASKRLLQHPPGKQDGKQAQQEVQRHQLQLQAPLQAPHQQQQAAKQQGTAAPQQAQRPLVQASVGSACLEEEAMPQPVVSVQSAASGGLSELETSEEQAQAEELKQQGQAKQESSQPPMKNVPPATAASGFIHSYGAAQDGHGPISAEQAGEAEAEKAAVVGREPELLAVELDDGGRSMVRKKRRLSWKQEVEGVLIKPPQSKPKKIVSWCRLARTWKPAKLTVSSGGG